MTTLSTSLRSLLKLYLHFLGYLSSISYSELPLFSVFFRDILGVCIIHFSPTILSASPSSQYTTFVPPSLSHPILTLLYTRGLSRSLHLVYSHLPRSILLYFDFSYNFIVFLPQFIYSSYFPILSIYLFIIIIYFYTFSPYFIQLNTSTYIYFIQCFSSLIFSLLHIIYSFSHSFSFFHSYISFLYPSFLYTDVLLPFYHFNIDTLYFFLSSYITLSTFELSVDFPIILPKSFHLYTA